VCVLVLVSIELQFLCSDSGFCQLPLFFIGGLFAVASKLKVLEDDCWTMNHRLQLMTTHKQEQSLTRDTTQQQPYYVILDFLRLTLLIFFCKSSCH
ncbi:MAG: hypothetical protein ACI8RD_014400, partial [Bacillariaceae sp.]|jgi:hypothetical protein